MRYKMAAVAGVSLLLGGVLGAYLFKDTRPRSFLALPHCASSCFSERELKAVALSVGIQYAPALLPNVVLETDKTIALKSPEPLATIDYLVLPKKDIRDLGDLSAEDAAYISDSFLVISQLVRQDNLHEYKVITNGPGFQQVNYLHFHLLAQ